MRHLSIHVEGKVQGVFFRASTKEKADELGIKGFVKNEFDGRVYIEAEGEDKALEQLISWCKKGPPRAIVNDVIIREGDMKNFSDFTVKR